MQKTFDIVMADRIDCRRAGHKISWDRRANAYACYKRRILASVAIGGHAYEVAFA